MLQQEESEDFVLATGETTSGHEFCTHAFKCLDIDINWQGEGVNEVGIDKESGKKIVEVDLQYFRPTEVEILLGDRSKAEEKLGWKPNYSIDELVKDMIESDFEKLTDTGLTGF